MDVAIMDEVARLRTSFDEETDMHRPNSSTGIRVPTRHGLQASQELRQALADLEARMERRKETLLVLWNQSKLPDRVLAVHRLLREGTVDAADAEQLQEHEQRVQAAWAQLRAARAAGEKARVLQLEVEVQLAERDRDNFLSSSGLIDQLFRYGETFLMDVPYDRDIRPLSEMLERKERILDQLSRLESRREPALKRRVAIRMLSPATMSSDGIPVMV